MRVLHKMKPEAYDPPEEGPAADVWTGPPSGPEFEAWVERSMAGPAGPLEGLSYVQTAAAIFVCEEGDLANDAAFEEMPPADVLAQLGPVTICAGCWPETAS
jgi:hypothetical protein